MDKLNLLGIAFKAGKLVHGTDLTLSAVRQNKVKLLILASDASENTKKQVRDKAAFYQVEVMDIFPSDALSKAIGKRNRMVLGILDKGIADSIKFK